MTIALVTAVLGGGLVAAATSYQLTGRLNREGRWWEARSRVYAEFLAACDRAEHIYLSDSERADALRRMDDLAGEISIFGSDEIAEVAREADEVLGDYYRRATKAGRRHGTSAGGGHAPSSWSSLAKTWVGLRRRARRSIDVG